MHIIKPFISEFIYRGCQSDVLKCELDWTSSISRTS